MCTYIHTYVCTGHILCFRDEQRRRIDVGGLRYRIKILVNNKEATQSTERSAKFSYWAGLTYRVVLFMPSYYVWMGALSLLYLCCHYRHLEPHNFIVRFKENFTVKVRKWPTSLTLQVDECMYCVCILGYSTSLL